LDWKTGTKDVRHATDRGTGWFCAGRLFWLSMFVLHGMALLSLWPALAAENGFAEQLGTLARLMGLSVSASFFALKIVDVPWLHLRPGWRSVVAAIVVIALLHVAVVDRALGSEQPFDAGRLGIVLFVGTVWQFDLLARVLRLVVALLMPLRVWRTHRSDTCLHRVWEAVFHPADLVYISSSTGPRAPPGLLAHK